ncbi:hypothetical protein ACFLZH_04895 [Patescibacteria group bacterium]
MTDETQPDLPGGSPEDDLVVACEETEQLQKLIGAVSTKDIAELDATMADIVEKNPRLIATLTKAVTSDAVRVAGTESPTEARKSYYKKLASTVTDATPEQIDTFLDSEEYGILVGELETLLEEVDERVRMMVKIEFVKLCQSSNVRSDFEAIVDSCDENRSEAARSEWYEVLDDLNRKQKPDDLREYLKNEDKMDIIAMEMRRNAMKELYTGAYDRKKIAMIYSYCLMELYRKGEVEDENYLIKTRYQSLNQQTVVEDTLQLNEDREFVFAGEEKLDEKLVKKLEAAVKEFMRENLIYLNSIEANADGSSRMSDKNLYYYLGLRRSPEGGFESVLNGEGSEELNQFASETYKREIAEDREKGEKRVYENLAKDLFGSEWQEGVREGLEPGVMNEGDPPEGRLWHVIPAIVHYLAYIQMQYEICQAFERLLEACMGLENAEEISALMDTYEQRKQASKRLEAAGSKLFGKRKALQAANGELEAAVQEIQRAEEALDVFIRKLNQKVCMYRFKATKVEVYKGHVGKAVRKALYAFSEAAPGANKENCLEEIKKYLNVKDISWTLQEIREEGKKAMEALNKLLAEQAIFRPKDDEEDQRVRMNGVVLPLSQQFEVPEQQKSYFESLMAEM